MSSVKYCFPALILIVSIISSSVVANEIDDYDFQVFEEEMAAARARATASETTTPTSIVERILKDEAAVDSISYYYEGKTI